MKRGEGWYIVKLLSCSKRSLRYADAHHRDPLVPGRRRLRPAREARSRGTVEVRACLCAGLSRAFGAVRPLRRGREPVRRHELAEEKAESALPRLCPLRRRAVLLLLQRARTRERAGKAAEGRAFSACGQPSLALRPAVDLPRARRIQHRLHLQALQPQDPGARPPGSGRLLPADRPRERPRGAQVDPLRGGLSQAGPLQHLHLPRGHAQQDAADAALPPRLVQDRPARARAAGDRRRQRHRHGEEKRPAPLHGRVHREGKA